MKKKICYALSFSLCLCLLALSEDNSAIENTAHHKKEKCKENAKRPAPIDKTETADGPSDLSPIAHFYLWNI